MMRGLVIAAMSAAVLAMACGGGGESRPTPSATATAESPSVVAEPTPTALPTATPTPEPSTLIAYEVSSSPASQEGTTILQSVSEIYGVDIETGERHLILANPDMTLVSWAWSPDGEFVAGLMMSRNLHTDRQARIDVVAADGTGQRTVWEANLNGPHPALNPEGALEGGYVVFSWSSDSEHLEVIAGDGATGATWVRLPLDGAPPGDVASLDAGSLYTPTWAGHGLVAVTRTDVTDSANWKVTVDLFTESGDHVTKIAAPAGYELGQLFFNAGGDLAVFGCHQLSPARAVIDEAMCVWQPDAEIAVVEGLTPRALSPDGTLVLTIDADEGTQPMVYRTGLLNLVTGERQALMDETGSVAWSPDGKQIAFSSGRDYPTPEPGQPFRRQIYVMNADGENQRKVTDETQPIAGTPRWQPR